MAIYFRTKSGIEIKEVDTPQGLVYVTKDGETLQRFYDEKGELVGLIDSNKTLIDDFVKDGKLESLALHKLSFDSYPDPNKDQKGKTVRPTEGTTISQDVKARLLEKTKRGKKDYAAMINAEKTDGGDSEKATEK